jgi:hypothetical protein
VGGVGLVSLIWGTANIMPNEENKNRSEVSKQRRGEVMHYIVRVYYGQGPPSTLFIHSEHNKYGSGDLGNIVYSLSMDDGVKLITAINERGDVEIMYEKDAS